MDLIAVQILLWSIWIEMFIFVLSDENCDVLCAIIWEDMDTDDIFECIFWNLKKKSYFKKAFQICLLYRPLLEWFCSKWKEWSKKQSSSIIWQIHTWSPEVQMHGSV